MGKGDYWNGFSVSLNDDISWIKSAHQMNFGVSAWQGRVNEFNHFTAPGTNILFTGQATGLGLSDFLLGDMSGFLQGLPNTYAPGFYFPGDPGFPGQSSAYRKWWHFDPRGGVAWDPKGDGRMSIRAAYTFGYAYVPGIAHEDEGGSNPWGGRVTLTSPAGGLANPWQGFAGGNPFPYTVSPTVAFTPAGQFMTTPYDLPSPTTYSWNISVQKQIVSDWVVTVTYIGSRVQHLYINEAINYGKIVPGPSVTSECSPAQTNCNALANVQARRVLSLLNPAAGQSIGNMDTWYPFGNQYYEALVSSIQKRFGHETSLSANWTWSHCVGYYQGFNSKPEETATNPLNPLFDRGTCDSDRRHIVNVTGVARMPSFLNHYERMLASNWQLAGIYKFISGAPISVQDGTDQELSGINHQRPNLVDPAHIYTGNACGGCFYLNKLAFSPQPLGTVGNLGWNSVTSPAYWDMDLAISRQFPIRERQTIEIRADAFNISNSFVPAFPGTLPPTQGGTAAPISPTVPAFAAWNGPQFGQILSAFPTRKVQFALKYMF